MIVKNGGKILGYAMLKNSNTLPIGAAQWSDGANTLVQFTTVTNFTKSTVSNVITDNSNTGVTMYLGLGNTPPTVNDYWLDETEVGGVNINSIIKYRSSTIGEGANGAVTYTFTFLNTSSDTSYTIKEIGLAIVPSNNSSDPRNGRCILIARKLITPRSVQPQETISFTYTISPCGGD